MKYKNRINTILDILLFLIILSLFFIKGEFHETIAYALGILLLAHLALHWQQFKTMYRQLLPQTKHQILAGVIVGMLVAAVLTSPLYLPDARGGRHGPPPGYGANR